MRKLSIFICFAFIITNYQLLEANIYISPDCRININVGAIINISGNLENDGLMQTQANSQVNLNGNLTNQGTFNANGGSFNFVGENNSAISSTSQLNFNTLDLNKSGSGNLSLNSDVGVNSKLLLNNGILQNAASRNSNIGENDIRNSILQFLENKEKRENSSKKNISEASRSSRENKTLSVVRRSLDNRENFASLSTNRTTGNLILENGVIITRRAGSLLATPSFAGTIDLIYDGVNTIVTGFEVPSGSSVLSNLTISQVNNVLMNSDMIVNGMLSFVEGNLITQSSSVYLGSIASLSESVGSMIIGTAVASPRNIGTGSINFLGINLSEGIDDLGNIQISRMNGAGSSITIGSFQSILNHWEISADSQPGNGRQMSVQWFDDFDNGVNLSLCQLWRSGDGGISWDSVGSIHNCSLSRTLTEVVNAFSEWTIFGNISAPANILISSLNGNVVLQWSAVEGADSYNIYSSTNPNLTLESWDLEEEGVNALLWQEAINDQRKFYYVKAISSPRASTIYRKINQNKEENE